jgi:lysine 2,3-aminomutase
MKQPGRRTEEPIYSRFRKLSRNEEGNPITLPFIDSVEELSRFFPLSEDVKSGIERVSRVYPFRIPEHYMSLIGREYPLSSPIGRQAIPSPDELLGVGRADPLNEGGSLKTPAFIQRYPGRGVFLVSAECAMYCRFCNRRRMVGKGWDPVPYREETLSYLEKEVGIREVIISGGDPFTLPPEDLDYILMRLKRMGKAVVRISTRIPVVSPERLTEAHYRALKAGSPLWVVIHINHPEEISPPFIESVKRLRGAEAGLVSQTVLLRGVNDCPYILGSLFEGLIRHGVKPYYLFQLDEAKGVCHFKVRLKTGVDIMKALRRDLSGLAMPCYALDIPGGLGKVPVDYRYAEEEREGVVRVESPFGGSGTYDDDGAESRCAECGVCKTAYRG